MWWGWCWSYVSAQAACRESYRTTPNSPSTQLTRKRVDSFSARGEGTMGNRRKPDWGGTNNGCRGLSGKSGSS